MAVNRKTGEIAHMMFPDIADMLLEGDLLVMNDTKVIRGRLRARKETGAAVEIFLLAAMGGRTSRGETCEALARPSKRLREGMVFRILDLLLKGDRGLSQPDPMDAALLESIIVRDVF